MVVIEHIDIQGPDVYTNEGNKYVYVLLSERATKYFNQAVRLIKQENLLDQNDANVKELQDQLLIDLKNCFKLFSAA